MSNERQEAALWAARHVHAFKDANASTPGRPLEDTHPGSRQGLYLRQDVQDFLAGYRSWYREGQVDESLTRLVNRLLRESPEYRLWLSQEGPAAEGGA